MYVAVVVRRANGWEMRVKSGECVRWCLTSRSRLASVAWGRCFLELACIFSFGGSCCSLVHVKELKALVDLEAQILMRATAACWFVLLSRSLGALG